MKSSSLKWALAFSSFLFLAVVLSPTAASAQGNGPFAQPPGPGGFGAAGQFVLTGGDSTELNNTPSFSLFKVSGDRTYLNIQPAVDYFVIPNVTIGAVVGLSTQSGRAATTVITLGARAGYNLQLGDRFSIWPTVGLNYQHFSFSDDAAPSGSRTYFNLDVPFLFHVIPHFFLGIGPFIHVGLGDGDPNVFGIQSLIGGWF